MLRRSVSLLAAVLLCLAAGCGGDDDAGGGGEDGGGTPDLTADEQAYVDQALEDFDAEESAPLTEDDARCVATSMVEEVGVDRLEEVGLTPESFTSEQEDIPDGLEREDAQKIVDGMSACIDMAALFLQGFEEEASLSEEAQECLAERFDARFVEELMVVLLSEGGEALSEDSGPGADMLAAYMECTV